MNIVVNINDCEYWKIKEDAEKFRSKEMVVPYLYKVIESGTPLPKGHGDLKDADELKNAFIKWSRAVKGNFTDADVASIVCNSPTIIKADKEGGRE